jgi:diguanylate cyclase (GGDEF)-like protein
LFTLLAAAVPCGAQGLPRARAAEAGAPLLRYFSPADYAGGTQNWAIVQDPRGVVYVGNVEDGVLEYDGVRWRHVKMEGKSVVRSLAVDAGGRVFVGGVGDFGYLEHDPLGQTRFVSLLSRLDPGDRDFADVWRVFATSHGVYFSTFRRLIRYSAQGVRVWNATSSFHLSFQAGDDLYVREVGRGLLRISGDDLVPVPGGGRYASEKVYALLPWPAATGQAPSSLLIATRTQGWFLHEGEVVRPWVTEVDAELADAEVYDAIWLQNGTLAVGTLHGGLFILDRHGRLLTRVDKTSGLPDNTVFAMREDQQNGLWLGLDKGIARLRLSMEISHFGVNSGYEGGVIDTFRHAGSLYAGTTQGLFRLDARTRPARFVAVANLRGQMWTSLAWQDSLLVGGAGGVHEVRGDVAHLVRSTRQMVFSLLRSARDPSRVYIGMHDGVAWMRNVGGRWVDEGSVRNGSLEVRTMFEAEDGSVWLGTENGGVGRLRAPAGGQARLELFGERHGLPRGPVFVYPLDGEALFATTRGLYRFDAARGIFVADARFAQLFPGGARYVTSLSRDRGGQIWMYSTDAGQSLKETGAAAPQADGTYRWAMGPLQRLSGFSVSSVRADDDGIVWLGADDGLFRYDPAQVVVPSLPFVALVRSVSGRDGRVIFAGAGDAPVARIAHADNSLRFEFAAASFGQANRFQVYLEGVDKGWSPWSGEAYRDYTNLHEGSYRFRVRAMNMLGAVSAESNYRFEVLPPWWRTWYAYLGFAMLLAGLATGLWRWRSGALSRHNAELARRVALQTAELSSANEALRLANSALTELSVTDALTGLKNRRYLIEHIEPDVAAVRRAYRLCRPGDAAPQGDLLFLTVDIDHFKQVNDLHGHLAGDRVLRQFAQVLRTACRDSDTSVRWGGEEFVVVARHVSRDAGPAIAERIRKLMASQSYALENGETLRRTCSIGFAFYPVLTTAPERYSWEDAVRLADQCLYVAKRSGRNTWVGAHATVKSPQCDEPGDAISLEKLVKDGYLQMRGEAPTDRQAVA